MSEESAARRMWLSACDHLLTPTTEESWKTILEHAPGDNVWHSLNNCISYQAEAWNEMVRLGAHEVVHPAAFRLAMVLRHTPSEVTLRLLGDLLLLHPQSQDLTSYMVALLTDDEAGSSDSPLSRARSGAGAPLRDLRLFGDCELSVLAAPAPAYDRHADLVRHEYARLSQDNYLQLRIKVLKQLHTIPQLFHTPEFAALEPKARDNVDREIRTLRAQLAVHPRNEASR